MRSMIKLLAIACLMNIAMSTFFKQTIPKLAILTGTGSADIKFYYEFDEKNKQVRYEIIYGPGTCDLNVVTLYLGGDATHEWRASIIFRRQHSLVTVSIEKSDKKDSTKDTNDKAISEAMFYSAQVAENKFSMDGAKFKSSVKFAINYDYEKSVAAKVPMKLVKLDAKAGAVYMVYTPSTCASTGILVGTFDYPTSVGDNRYWKTMSGSAIIDRIMIIAIAFILAALNF